MGRTYRTLEEKRYFEDRGLDCEAERDYEEDGAPPSPVEPPAAPPIETFCGGWEPPTWLRDLYEGLSAQPSCYARVAAVGAIYRFCIEAPADVWPSIRHAVTSWYAGLYWEVRVEAFHAGFDETERLQDGIGGLCWLVADRPRDAYWPALGWLHQRDVLECVVTVVEACGDEHLRRAADDLDGYAATFGSMWSFLPSYADEGLEAVRRLCPDCWWGALAEKEGEG